jgi:hypothetical protein
LKEIIPLLAEYSLLLVNVCKFTVVVDQVLKIHRLHASMFVLLTLFNILKVSFLKEVVGRLFGVLIAFLAAAELLLVVSAHQIIVPLLRT